MNDFPKSEMVSDIYAPELYHGLQFPMWVLYDHPTDMPDHYVLRLWDCAGPTPTASVFISPALDDIEAQIDAVPGCFWRLPPTPGDDPKIIAAYL